MLEKFAYFNIFAVTIFLILILGVGKVIFIYLCLFLTITLLEKMKGD
jgi:hypothetical protein